MCLTDGRDLLSTRSPRHPAVARYAGTPYEKIAFATTISMSISRGAAPRAARARRCSEKLDPRNGDARAARSGGASSTPARADHPRGAVFGERSSGGELETPRARGSARRTESRTFDVVHRTIYKYAPQPVERSTHLLR